MSPAMRDLFWLSNVPLGTTCCVIGIIGNLLSVYIWRRIVGKSHQYCHSTAMYLFTLGIVDIGLLSMFLLTESLSTAVPAIKTSWSYAMVHVWFFYPLLGLFTVASIWMIVGVTINRWILITFPFRSRIIYTTNNTLIGLALTTLFSLFVNIPHWFRYRVITGVNQTGLIVLTKFGSSDVYKRYEFWCHCMVLVLVPWVIIAVLNILMVKKLRNRLKQVSFVDNRPRGMKEDRNLTVMLLIITFTFLLLIAWQCITQCFYMLLPNDDGDWKQASHAYAFGKLGVILNSSTNWLIYGIYGSRFRIEMKETVFSWVSKEESPKLKIKSVVSTISIEGRENELYNKKNREKANTDV